MRYVATKSVIPLLMTTFDNSLFPKRRLEITSVAIRLVSARFQVLGISFSRLGEASVVLLVDEFSSLNPFLPNVFREVRNVDNKYWFGVCFAALLAFTNMSYLRTSNISFSRFYDFTLVSTFENVQRFQ